MFTFRAVIGPIYLLQSSSTLARYARQGMNIEDGRRSLATAIDVGQAINTEKCLAGIWTIDSRLTPQQKIADAALVGSLA